MSRKLLKNQRTRIKLGKKIRELNFLKSSLEDFNTLFSDYEMEMSDAIADISALNSEKEEAKSEHIKNEPADFPDNEETIEESLKKYSDVPKWAKKLYKQIALKTHPDKLENLNLSQEEKERREKIFKECKDLLINQEHDSLINAAYDLGLEVELPDDQHLKLLEKSIKKIKEEMHSRENKAPWIWGALEGEIERRVNLMIQVREKLGEPAVSRELVQEYIEYFERDQISEWKNKHLKQNS